MAGPYLDKTKYFLFPIPLVFTYIYDANSLKAHSLAGRVENASFTFWSSVSKCTRFHPGTNSTRRQVKSPIPTSLFFLEDTAHPIQIQLRARAHNRAGRPTLFHLQSTLRLVQVLHSVPNILIQKKSKNVYLSYFSVNIITF